MSLDMMRAHAEQMMRDTCTLERKTRVSDGAGGSTETWADQAADVPCFIEPAGGGEIGMAGDRISDKTTHVVYLPAGTDVTEADRVIVAGDTFDVTAVRRWGSVEVYRAAEVKEVA